jgi:hypothetical protein
MLDVQPAAGASPLPRRNDDEDEDEDDEAAFQSTSAAIRQEVFYFDPFLCPSPTSFSGPGAPPGSMRPPDRMVS